MSETQIIPKCLQGEVQVPRALKSEIQNGYMLNKQTHELFVRMIFFMNQSFNGQSFTEQCKMVYKFTRRVIRKYVTTFFGGILIDY